MDLDRFKQLTTQIAKAQGDADRARGSLDQLTGELEREFDCPNEEEAGKLLKRLRKEVGEAESAYNEMLRDFLDDWGDKL